MERNNPRVTIDDKGKVLDLSFEEKTLRAFNIRGKKKETTFLEIESIMCVYIYIYIFVEIHGFSTVNKSLGKRKRQLNFYTSVDSMHITLRHLHLQSSLYGYLSISLLNLHC